MSRRGAYDLYRGQTPGQTLGPYFHQGLLRTWRAFQVPGLCSEEDDYAGAAIAGADVPGKRLRLEGRVLDGRGRPVADALLEVWQANAEGRYFHPLDAGAPPAGGFTGFGRAATDEGGHYAFSTIKPGRVRAPDGGRQAPHLNLVLGARGMARHAFTRVYFEEDDLASDAVMRFVPEHRRKTLVACNLGEKGGVCSYRFDLRLQGKEETVFFDF